MLPCIFLGDHAITYSMSLSGNVVDNAAIESLST